MKKAFVDQIRGNDPLVERPKNVIQGTVAGFPVNAVMGVNGGGYWRIVIDAKEGRSNPSYPMDTLLAGIRSGNSKVTSAGYNGRRIEIMMKGSGKAGIQIREIFNQAAAYLSQNGYVPCCGACGEEVPAVLTSINGYMDFMCDSCYENACRNLEAHKQEKAEKKGNIVTGIVGALLGALVGGILWVLIYQLGYIAGAAGLVAAVCALKGYEKFGGKVNVAGVIISLVIVVAVIYFAHNVGVALEIQRELKDYGFTFMDSYRSIPELMTYPDFSGAFWKDLIIGYGLTAIASFATVRSMFQNSTGAYKTGRY